MTAYQKAKSYYYNMDIDFIVEIANDEFGQQVRNALYQVQKRQKNSRQFKTKVNKQKTMLKK